jgi:hypothetical protein
MGTLCKLIIIMGVFTRLVESLQCLAGFTLNNGVCYDFRSITSVSFYACQSTCASTGSMMPCIEDLAQHNYIYSHISTAPYIWLGVVKSGGTWNWPAGCPSTYFKWNTGEGTSGEAFALIHSGVSGNWVDVDGGNTVPPLLS